MASLPSLILILPSSTFDKNRGEAIVVVDGDDDRCGDIKTEPLLPPREKGTVSVAVGEISANDAVP